MAAGVSLREVRPEDVAVFFEHQRDEDSTRMAAFPARERDAHAAHWAKILGDPAVHARTIERDGEVAGNVVSWLAGGGREIGYWIGREHWGKGVASEALRQFLEAVPERPLHAFVAPHNVGSIRVLEKCGFGRAAAGTTGDGLVPFVLR